MHGQEIDIFGGVGYANYDYKELKDYQNYLSVQFPVETTTTDEFPPYYTYLFGINVKLSNWTIGIEAGHGSTGGRVYYQDYSGSVIGDQLIKYNYLGFVPALYLYKKNSLSVTGGLKILVVRHSLEIKNSLQIGSQILNEQKNFYGLNLGLQPHIAFQKNFGSFFLRAAVGYEFQSNSYPESKDSPRLFLNNGAGTPVHLRGDGYRLNLSCGFTLNSKVM